MNMLHHFMKGFRGGHHDGDGHPRKGDGDDES